uniref:J domain-containing protein n=1 Tax=Macrostomum lignano TaxID=282301 RepID=A0A1I8JE06_9PLAT
RVELVTVTAVVADLLVLSNPGCTRSVGRVGRAMRVTATPVPTAGEAGELDGPTGDDEGGTEAPDGCPSPLARPRPSSPLLTFRRLLAPAGFTVGVSSLDALVATSGFFVAASAAGSPPPLAAAVVGPTLLIVPFNHSGREAGSRIIIIAVGVASRLNARFGGAQSVGESCQCCLRATRLRLFTLLADRFDRLEDRPKLVAWSGFEQSPTSSSTLDSTVTISFLVLPIDSAVVSPAFVKVKNSDKESSSRSSSTAGGAGSISSAESALSQLAPAASTRRELLPNTRWLSEPYTCSTEAAAEAAAAVLSAAWWLLSRCCFGLSDSLSGCCCCLRLWTERFAVAISPFSCSAGLCRWSQSLEFNLSLELHCCSHRLCCTSSFSPAEEASPEAAFAETRPRRVSLDTRSDAHRTVLNDASLITSSSGSLWHPDKHPAESKAEAEDRFKLISEAFQVLSDPVGRRQHDETLKERKKQQKKQQEQQQKQQHVQECFKPPQQGFKLPDHFANSSGAATHYSFKTTKSTTRTFMCAPNDATTANEFINKMRENLRQSCGNFNFRDAYEVYREYFDFFNSFENMPGCQSRDSEDDQAPTTAWWETAVKLHQPDKFSSQQHENIKPTETIQKTTRVRPDGVVEEVTRVTRMVVTTRTETVSSASKVSSNSSTRLTAIFGCLPANFLARTAAEQVLISTGMCRTQRGSVYLRRIVDPSGCSSSTPGYWRGKWRRRIGAKLARCALPRM